jgi:hypothetical protein
MRSRPPEPAALKRPMRRPNPIDRSQQRHLMGQFDGRSDRAQTPTRIFTVGRRPGFSVRTFKRSGFLRLPASAEAAVDGLSHPREGGRSPQRSGLELRRARAESGVRAHMRANASAQVRPIARPLRDDQQVSAAWLRVTPAFCVLRTPVDAAALAGRPMRAGPNARFRTASQTAGPVAAQPVSGSSTLNRAVPRRWGWRCACRRTRRLPGQALRSLAP